MTRAAIGAGAVGCAACGAGWRAAPPSPKGTAKTRQSAWQPHLQIQRQGISYDVAVVAFVRGARGVTTRLTAGAFTAGAFVAFGVGRGFARRFSPTIRRQRAVFDNFGGMIGSC